MPWASKSMKIENPKVYKFKTTRTLACPEFQIGGPSPSNPLGATMVYIPYAFFKVERVTVRDSVGGRGTRVSHLFVGATSQIGSVDVFPKILHAPPYSADFNLIEHFEKVKLDLCHPLLGFSWNVHFEQVCTWECVLEGDLWTQPMTTYREIGGLSDSMRESLEEMLRLYPPT